MKSETPLNKFFIAFSDVEDPRIDRKKQFSLMEVLFLVVSAILSDCDTWEEIEWFGEMKLGWLRKYLPYTNGIPSHDTINRVMSLLDVEALQRAFINWATMEVNLPNGALICFDGKKLCGSASKTEQQLSREAGGKYAKHILHAWCAELEICLGQIEVEDKTNEITAIPQMLEILSEAIVIKGAVITIDAIGCQKAITEKIVEKGADFVIGVKDNQPRLRQAIEDAFSNTDVENMAEGSDYEAEKKSHNRIERRVCSVISAGELSEEIRSEWPLVKSITRVTSKRYPKGKEEEFCDRYYITSLELDSKQIAMYIRGHWGIENKLHWQLDVTFGEDASQKQTQNAAQNFSAMLKVALNLITTNALEKGSKKGKRKKCAFSDNYREKCFGF